MSDKIIKSTAIDASLISQWGVKVYEYTYNDPGGVSSSRMDLQDVVAKVGTKRAAGIEKEITALAAKMRLRNTQLDWLAALLGDLGKAASQFKSDDSNQNAKITVSEKSFEGMKLLSEGNWEWWIKYNVDSKTGSETVTEKRLHVTINNVYMDWNYTSTTEQNLKQSNYELMNQLAKSKTDALNNESQADMTKLQGWVAKRDEGYSTATSLMTSVSETRSNLIKNF